MKRVAPMAKNALTEQQALFVHHVESGVAPASAAALAGFAAPHDAARRLMRLSSVQAHLMEAARALDVELENKSRFVLRALLDAEFTAPQIKARIALDLVKRADKKDAAATTRNLAEMPEAELVKLIDRAQRRLADESGQIIDITPDPAA